MKERILENINNPDHLEHLYLENKQDFSNSFMEIGSTYESELIRFWKIRLAPGTEHDVYGFLKLDLLILIILSLVSECLVKLPQI